ncbi:DUF302 domain-containing protein [Roseovarius autotrophicus]|uniref:DUF302 domain-containing protein n=1 Tax=Roseovarius autotrophicus TaxID=2824121 RepID=UPI0019DF7CC1|nr:DUF302 domain-containing protein [Roseovarius autotrophicus]MBE0453397.1 DUF302 domain-containing protein [Roseovarius sp.]
MQRFLKLLAVLTLFAGSAQALEPREGWVILKSGQSFEELVKSVNTVVETSEIRIVNQASASAGAKMQGITIPGNRVFGLYRNDYARRMLDASIAAGIEAPIMLYATENADGTSTLAYKTPSHVFAPYFDEGGDALRDLAAELDGVFEAVAKAAVAD